MQEGSGETLSTSPLQLKGAFDAAFGAILM